MTGDSAPPRAVTETLEAARKFSSGQWRQHLRVSRVGETVYIDEGNGAFEVDRTSSRAAQRAEISGSSARFRSLALTRKENSDRGRVETEAEDSMMSSSLAGD